QNAASQGPSGRPAPLREPKAPLTEPEQPPPPPATPPPKPPADGPAGRRPGTLVAGLFIASAVLFVAFFAFIVFSTGPKQIAYNEFLSLVERGQIAKLQVIGATKAVGEVRNPDDPLLKDLELPKGKFAVVLPKDND